MSEEVTQVVSEENATTITTDTSVATSLAEMMLGEKLTDTKTEDPVTTASEEKTDEVVVDTKTDEELVDENIYLKNKFGWESEEVALNEIKALKEKAEKADKGFEYKNEDSKKIAEYINEGKIDELTSFFDTQKKVDKLLKADLSDKKAVEELVKFNIKQQNLGLEQEDIDFLFEEKYSIPKEPKQKDDELDDEFAERHAAWNEQRERIEKRMVIEAKMAQPKLEQLKSELVLPEIHKENTQQQMQQPSQEDLAAFTKAKDSFIQSAQQTVNSFNGFSVQVKDKDVDYTVGYVPSNDEKTFVSNELKKFAEAGFDANALLAERWVEADGKTLKVDVMTKDLLSIYTNEKLAQKLATDSANKRLEAYLKEKKQINVNGLSNQGTFNPNQPKTEIEALTEAILAM